MPGTAADSKTVTIAAKVSPADAEAIDAARGAMTRSAWIQQAIGVVLGTVPLSLAVPGYQGSPAVPVPCGGQNGTSQPRSGSCPHPNARVFKGLCGACGTGGLTR